MQNRTIKRNILPLICAVIMLGSCASGISKNTTEYRNKKFLNPAPKDAELAQETFRVVMSSDEFKVSQIKNRATIRRQKDPGGDSFICDEIKKYDKINEVREGLFKIWLYPDRGTLMKIRPQKSTFLLEIDRLILEDLQRWSFKFPTGAITPLHMFIRYRVILKKAESDKKIIKELQENIRD